VLTSTILANANANANPAVRAAGMDADDSACLTTWVSDKGWVLAMLHTLDGACLYQRISRRVLRKLRTRE